MDLVLRDKRTDRGGMEIKQQTQISRTKERKNLWRLRRDAEAMREGGEGGRERSDGHCCRGRRRLPPFVHTTLHGERLFDWMNKV